MVDNLSLVIIIEYYSIRLYDVQTMSIIVIGYKMSNFINVE